MVELRQTGGPGFEPVGLAGSAQTGASLNLSSSEMRKFTKISDSAAPVLRLSTDETTCLGCERVGAGPGTSTSPSCMHTRQSIVAEGEDNLKKMQLMELAILNGTYRDTNVKTRECLRNRASSPHSPTRPPLLGVHG
ncbi:hypothetical protein Z043_119085 [Scleropages formosus]|uniref:Uncharacterized protein n=1 Tax=Scleropages formosus TaxID=113540 RepID=A0A0N8JX45_SCLFO|nr:hypothetical protein Z043_119085 [Scleropages formosus]